MRIILILVLRRQEWVAAHASLDVGQPVALWVLLPPQERRYEDMKGNMAVRSAAVRASN
jgi:hypothetical protein